MRLTKGVLAAVLSMLSAAAVAPTRTRGTGTGRATGQATNRPPSVRLTPAPSRVTLPSGCPEDERPIPWCKTTSLTVRLKAEASDPDGNRLLYTYLTNGGRLSGDGPDATLDLTGVAPGVYTVTVEVGDGRGGGASDSTRIEVSRCACPEPLPRPPSCPTVTVSCPDTPGPDGRLTYTAAVSGGDPTVTPTYGWEVSAGIIRGGQGTHSITVDVSKHAGRTFTATVDVGGYERSCATSASCTIMPGLLPVARKLDEYGFIPTGDEKLRLDNFTVELQNDPAARGYLVCYRGRRGRAGEGRRRCLRARHYLVSTRGIEASRVVTVDGGLRDALTVELWLTPAGALPPP